MINVQVKIDGVINIQKDIYNFLNNLGLYIVEDAKETHLFTNRTGRLESSIGYNVINNRLLVKASTPYAIFVHNKYDPFLDRAIENVFNRI